MIEFKADCGHTVRAKDEDAGRVVRCAYCGREAPVPQDDHQELDFLFAGADREDSDAGSKDQDRKRAGRSGRGGMPFHGAVRTRVDPFAVVKKMSYIAAILMCIIYVGKKYAWPAFSEAILSDAPVNPPLAVDPVSPRLPAPTIRPPPRQQVGFLNTPLGKLGKEGVYINPVPSRMTAYYCEAGPDTRGFDWIRDPRAERVDTPGEVDLGPGSYVIVAMLPINDRALKQYKPVGYNALRWEVENKPRNADSKVDEYFRSDEATAVKVIELSGRINLARRYEITIQRGQWTMLTPQFLPYNCSLMRMSSTFLPKTRAYGFDEEDLQSELEFYGVKKDDWQYMEDILHRIGSISYREADGRFRIFKIDPLDGMISAPYLAKVRRAAPELNWE